MGNMSLTVVGFDDNLIVSRFPVFPFSRFPFFKMYQLIWLRVYNYIILGATRSTATGVVKRNSPTVPHVGVSRRNFDDDKRMLWNAEQAGLSMVICGDKPACTQITITKTRSRTCNPESNWASSRWFRASALPLILSYARRDRIRLNSGLVKFRSRFASIPKRDMKKARMMCPRHRIMKSIRVIMKKFLCFTIEPTKSYVRLMSYFTITEPPIINSLEKCLLLLLFDHNHWFTTTN